MHATRPRSVHIVAILIIIIILIILLDEIVLI